MGLCQKTVASTVLAEQTFTCTGTLATLPPGSAVAGVTFTGIAVTCTPVFTAPAGIGFTFTLSGTIALSTPPFEDTFTDVPVSCSGTFCNLAVPVADQPLVGCRLLRPATVTATDSVDPDTAEVVVTVAVVATFALVHQETIIVALCANTAVTGISATPCRDDGDESD